MVNVYLDNLYKQIYLSDTENQTGVASGSSKQMTFGLSDIGELPGASTWFIRSIRFNVQGYQDIAGLAPDTRIRIQGWISNRDISSTIYAELGDLQDVQGFPLNKVQKNLLVQNTAQHNFFSYQYTYRPSKNLTLNREQNIGITAKNVAGNDMTFMTSVYLHAERGD